MKGCLGDVRGADEPREIYDTAAGVVLFKEKSCMASVNRDAWGGRKFRRDYGKIGKKRLLEWERNLGPH